MISKIGQLMFIGLSGKELTTAEADFIVTNNIGGVVLFSRNIESPQQVHQLCSDLYELTDRFAEKLPLFIGIDMEGGRVLRLKEPFTAWPPLRQLGDLNSASLAFKFAQYMGLEMRSVGINLDFAPCVDVLTNLQNQVIGDRAISDDPEIVASIASALVRGYIKADIIPCAKHFPGHGNTLADSHEELPIELTDIETLMNRELIPFKKAFRARLDLVMTAHIKYENIDPEFPVTLSRHFLQKILREELRYQRLIISDDLDMKALSNNYAKEDLPIMALAAGCDLLLYCNEPDSPPAALAALEKALVDKKIHMAQLNESYDKVIDLKQKRLPKSIPDLNYAARLVGNPEHRRIVEAITSGVVPEDLKK